MKKIKLFFPIIILGIFSLFSSIVSAQDTDLKQRYTIDPETSHEMLVGEISIDQLEEFQGFEALKNQNDPTSSSGNAELSQLLEGVEIEAFIGTWCDDSQYFFPEIINLLKAAGYDVHSIKITGLDENKMMMDGSAPPHEVEYVPTFIFYKNGNELGRFVEYAKEGLPDDIIHILQSGQ